MANEKTRLFCWWIFCWFRHHLLGLVVHPIVSMNWLLLILCATPIITDTDGLAIHACHDDDRVLVEVVPINTNRIGGMFVTAKRVLYLRDLTMIPSGTNEFRLRTICDGSTGAVTVVQCVLRRPVPAPSVTVQRTPLVWPPMPQGMVMALPDATNQFPSYSAYRAKIEAQQRRSQ
jgi:hypothetical protein